MTTLREELDPKVAVSLTNTGTTEPKQYSLEAAKLLNAEPVKTAWGWDNGRPVYNRLPMISEAYQKSYDEDHAVVYLDFEKTNRSVGVNTLEVQRDKEDSTVLNIQNGTVLWKEGEVYIEEVSLSTLDQDDGRGLQPGLYQVGYTLTSYEDFPDTVREGYALAYGEDIFVSDIELAYAASSETPLYRKEYAIYESDDDKAWRADNQGLVGGYYKGASYTLDFLSPVVAEYLTIQSDGENDTASMAVYGSDDAIIWHLQDQTFARNGQWKVQFTNEPSRYRRLFFWDGTAAIENIKYSGEAYFLDRSVRPPKTRTELFVESMYEEIQGNFILLATFEVLPNGAIVHIKDMRRVSYEKYQPVADWLTKFEDEQLRCLFDDVVQYNKLYMAPPTTSTHLYTEMDYNTCLGKDEITLGSVSDEVNIIFPDVVEYYSVSDMNIKTVVDMNVISINLLAEPTGDSSVATKKYTDYTLTKSWSMDNGVY